MEKSKETQRKEADSLTAVAHHVKGPIYVLKGYLDALVSGDLGELDEKQKKYIKICLENVDKVNIITSGLVRVMEIEDGKYRLEKKPVDIIKETEEIVESNLHLAKASNTSILVKKETDSLFVLTDKTKIRETIDSLLTNAIKYKDQREGLIEIKIEKKEDDIIVSVKDNGIGILDEDKKKIFSKFYRTRKAIQLDPNSLGLELYICKAVIELSGGKIWVEDNKEEGSVFFFTLPFYKGE